MKIDQILIKIANGHNLVTLDQWMGMPLEERICVVREDRVQFLSGGEPVGTRQALQAIKAERT